MNEQQQMQEVVEKIPEVFAGGLGTVTHRCIPCPFRVKEKLVAWLEGDERG